MLRVMKSRPKKPFTAHPKAGSQRRGGACGFASARLGGGRALLVRLRRARAFLHGGLWQRHRRCAALRPAHLQLRKHACRCKVTTISMWRDMPHHALHGLAQSMQCMVTRNLYDSFELAQAGAQDEGITRCSDRLKFSARSPRSAGAHRHRRTSFRH